MANYDRSVVVNPTTLRVFLKRPQANFMPSVLGRTYLGIVSKAWAEKTRRHAEVAERGGLTS